MLNVNKKHPRHIQRLKKKADIWAQRLGKLMGVRAIFLSGSVAQESAGKDSDIDFFFIAKHKQIWTARFFVFVWLKFYREIATPEDHAEKICPNHFISDKNLEIKEKDAYAANLFSHNIPLYDPDNIFPVFAKKNQHWVQRFGESFDKSYLKLEGSPMPHSKRRQVFCLLLESFLAFVQKKKIAFNPEKKLPGAKIILTENELRFHPRPKNKDFEASSS